MWRSETTKFGLRDRKFSSYGNSWHPMESVEWKLRGPKFAFLFRSGSPGRIRTSDQPVNSATAYFALSSEILAQIAEIAIEFCSPLFPRGVKKCDLTSTLQPNFHHLSTLKLKESCKGFDGDFLLAPLREPSAERGDWRIRTRQRLGRPGCEKTVEILDRPCPSGPGTAHNMQHRFG